MRTFYFEVLFLGLWISGAVSQNAPVADVFYVVPATPTCLSVTSNDPSGSTLVSVTNGTYGRAFIGVPPFYLAGSTTVTVEAEHYYTNNYGEPSNPSYNNDSPHTWNGNTDKGTMAMMASPNSRTNVNPDWGIAMEYNVLFRSAGAYRFWVRGITDSWLDPGSDDSVHVLWRNPLTNELVFVSSSDPLDGYNFWSGFQWKYSSSTVTVTSDMLGVIHKVYIAMREDGFIADRWAMSLIPSTTLWTSEVGDPESTLVSCANDQILYFPIADVTGIDTIYYSTPGGTAKVSVYLGVTVPSPSPTPSQSASPSNSPSNTPSVSPSPSSSPSRSASPSVTPSISVSPSASVSPGSSPSTTPSVTPSQSPSPSVTPSASPTPSPTPSVTPTTTPSITPSISTSPSITPSGSPSPIQQLIQKDGGSTGTNIPLIVGLTVGLSFCAVGAMVGAFVFVRKRRNSEDDPEATDMLLMTPLIGVADEKLRSFEQILLAEGYRLVKATVKYTQITEADKIANWLVTVFEYNGLTIDLIKSLIAREVKLALQAGALMRANSMASKMMKSLSALIAKPFIKSLFAETIEFICQHPLEDGASFEVDPVKILPGESLQKNQQRLLKYCNIFLKKIFESVEQAPLEFREICNALQRRVCLKFPENTQICVGGFLFLRVFCPAIVAPSGFGVISAAPSAPAQRGLTLIAKTLQNLANNIQFGSKEGFMTWLNPFIQENLENCMEYFDKMATIPVHGMPALTNIEPEARDQALGNLYKHVKTLYPKMKEKYSGKDFFERFTKLAEGELPAITATSSLETRTSDTPLLDE